MTVFAEEYQVASPDQDLHVKVQIGQRISYSVIHKSQTLLEPSPIFLNLAENRILGENPQVLDVNHRTVNEEIVPSVRIKSRVIPERFNEMSVEFESGFSLVFRAYDEGVAYRFATGIEGDITVVSEGVTFNFGRDHSIYFPEEESFQSHSEREYKYFKLSGISDGMMCSLPALVDVAGGPKVLITEADLEDYPGLYLRGNKSHSLSGKFPGYALAEEARNDRDVPVTKRADFIAKTRGRRDFPWRVLIVAEKDGDLIENQMVYLLGKPLQLDDASWIKPGKVAWDWWNANNLYGVDFRAGINTQTYKYYIDFAARYGLEYIILDEGWYVLGDLTKVSEGMDMEELFRYAKSKNVGIIPWVIWKTLDDQLAVAMDQFERWGAKGLKVDFMQREDQWMVNFYHKIAKETAKRHILVDFHGSFKPTGLRRAYPNVITREGVPGLEHSKWSKDANPEHNVTIPFIRMVAGPMDYTPGAMINAQEKDFQPIFNRPMSMGTRCHQLAMYVVYIYKDGINADRYGNDYKHETTEIAAGDKMRIKLAPGGGWAAVIR